MIQIIILITILSLIMRLFYALFVIGYYTAIFLILLFLLFLVYFIGKSIWIYIERNRIEKYLNYMTTKVNLDKLSDKDIMLLIDTIEQFEICNKSLKVATKNNLIAMAIGYTLTNVGVNESIKYGLGYVGLDKLINKGSTHNG